MQAQLQQLIAISRRYGADSDFVLAGGGNTSVKSKDRLWVKASGHALATIGLDGLVELDRHQLDAMLNGEWPSDPKAREAAFVEAVMAARIHPELDQRPSVEALLHHLLPSTFVVHTHPGSVNALTCCAHGQALTKALFGDTVLWQPYVDPGLILAKRLAEQLTIHRARTGAVPTQIFLENHGLIIGGESAEQIESQSTHIVDALRQRIGQAKELASIPVAGSADTVLQRYAEAITEVKPELSVVTDDSDRSRTLVCTPAVLAAALAGPLTPDQIVYCRSIPLFFDDPARDAGQAAEQFRVRWDQYVATHGFEPWVALVAGVGLLAFRQAPKLAEISRVLYVDSAAVYANAARLGGVKVLSPAERQFIEQWEVEAFRRSVMSAQK